MSPHTFRSLALVFLAGCSVINDADDFRVGCSMDEQCEALPNATPFCDTTGMCGLGDCNADYRSCDDMEGTGCETLVTTPTNCGECGVTCEVDTPLCQAGLCVDSCDAGFTECSGTCADTTGDVNNCGGCGIVCTNGASVTSTMCVDSTCGVAECSAGFGDCDGDFANGCEVETSTDAMNCGGCGVVCGDGVSCVNGICDPYVKVTTQWDHVCALRESGSVDCWGLNASFEANGVDGNVPLEAPSRVRWAPPGESDVEDLRVRDISVGNGFTCFISAHTGPSMGRLYCAGSNSGTRRGASVDSPSWPPQPVEGDQGGVGFEQVELGAYFGCAIDVNGDVWCWGENAKGQNGSTALDERLARRVPFSQDVTEIAAGHSAVCAVLTDGTVECLGANESGQLGRGGAESTAAFATPEAVVGTDGTGTLSGIVDLVGNAIGFCAIDEGETLFCWGRAGLTIETTPVEVANGVSEAMVFNFASCWLDSTTGEATCMGRTQEAFFGDAMPEAPARTEPSPAPDLDGLTGVDGGYRGGCGFGADGELRCWGYSVYGTTLRDTLVEETPVPVVGADRTPVAALSNLAMGREGTCAVSGGNAFCWGSGGRTDFGNGRNISYAYPVQIPDLTGVVDVARSDFGGACAIAASGAGDTQLYCWSVNVRGRLGGIGASAREPTVVPGIPSPTQVDMAREHSCAIVAGGEVMCWGANNFGQVGTAATGSTNTSELPTYVQLDGSRITASHITVGYQFSCAILTGAEAGQVVCWGAGGDGQLGHGSSPTSSAPVRATLTDAVAVEAGLRHICAIGGDPNRVYCWGDGAFGQGGDGTDNDSNMPRQVAGTAPTPVSVAAGYSASCAAYDDDSVRCWGNNDYSQLGTTGGPSLEPQLVPGVSARVVAAGSEQDLAFCAGTNGGTWECWGLNDHGKLGTSPDIHFTPQVVPR